MTIEKAILILLIEKGVAELDIINDNDNQHTLDFVEAVNVILNFINDFEDMVAEIETLKKDRAKAKQLFDEISAIGKCLVLDGGRFDYGEIDR